MRGRGLPPLSKMRLGAVAMGARARLEIGVVESEGKAWVSLKIGREHVRVSPERAEEIAVDLRNFALEIRNGGQLT